MFICKFDTIMELWDIFSTHDFLINDNQSCSFEYQYIDDFQFYFSSLDI